MATMTGTEKKARGAYYTPSSVAAWLSSWAVRTSRDRVMDPSLGDGVFLEAAIERIKELGGKPGTQFFGCEISPDTHKTLLTLGKRHRIPPRHLYCQDFFSLCSDPKLQVEAQIGNPPYIRYQRFSGDARKQALDAAASAGVKLNQLSSAWAPFIVHACTFLAPGGRLAMVLPYELTYANYARPVLEYLLAHFDSLELITFQERIFQDLAEDTVLLLAEGYGKSARRFVMHGYAGLEALFEGKPQTSTEIDIPAWKSGNYRLASALLPSEIQGMYAELTRHPKLVRLGELASIDIGYVSGNNSYFHLTDDYRAKYRFAAENLRPTIVNSRDLRGLSYHQADFEEALQAGKASWLFYPQTVGKAEKGYIAQGESQEVHKAYKCRVRSPWWKVAFVNSCDAVLTVMSNLAPRMVVNELGAMVSNSLLTIRFKKKLDPWKTRLQVAASYTSLSQLSAEIEGHSLGGGALKLEPGEAKQLLLPKASAIAKTRPDDLEEIDRVLRLGNLEEAIALGDMYILQGALGFTTAEIAQIRKGVALLRQRRRGK